MTDRYAVIGHPISHSKSPLIHQLFAEQTRQDISYEAIEAPLDGFAATVERLRKAGYKGCNVTVPFKFDAFQIAPSNLTARAQAAKAVNTFTFGDATLLGDNTDGVGLVTDLEKNFAVDLLGKRTLLMGAGGAAWGVALPLMQKGAVITIVNRTENKACELAQFLRRSLSTDPTRQLCAPKFVANYAALSGQTFDLVINATSSGLSNELAPLPPGIFAPNALAYDMMYGRETPFMRFAREQGTQVADGLGMLVEQAAEAFFIWRGVRPDTAPVMEKLRKP